MAAVFGILEDRPAPAVPWLSFMFMAGFLSAENPGKARSGYLTFGVLRGLWELIIASRLVTQWMTQFLISRS